MDAQEQAYVTASLLAIRKTNSTLLVWGGVFWGILTVLSFAVAYYFISVNELFPAALVSIAIVMCFALCAFSLMAYNKPQQQPSDTMLYRLQGTLQIEEIRIGAHKRLIDYKPIIRFSTHQLCTEIVIPQSWYTLLLSHENRAIECLCALPDTALKPFILTISGLPNQQEELRATEMMRLNPSREIGMVFMRKRHVGNLRIATAALFCLGLLCSALEEILWLSQTFYSLCFITLLFSLWEQHLSAVNQRQTDATQHYVNSCFKAE